jgi:ribosome maturation factor RimP
VGVDPRAERSSRGRAVPEPADGADPSEAAGRMRTPPHDRNVATSQGRGSGDRSGRSHAELRELLEPLVNRTGFDLEGFTVTPVGRRRQLRVVVDSDGGIDLDDVATLSEAISTALDASDVMGAGPYVLEVTSPGVDRPLTEPRHWRRAAGRMVRAPLADGATVVGRVVGADDETVVLDVAGDERRFRYTELGRGRVQVEFRRDDGGEG